MALATRGGWHGAVQPWVVAAQGRPDDVETARALFRDEVETWLAEQGVAWPRVTEQWEWDAAGGAAVSRHYGTPRVEPHLRGVLRALVAPGPSRTRPVWWRWWLFGPKGRR